MEDNQHQLFLMSIVAIVAIVALFALIHVTKQPVVSHGSVESIGLARGSLSLNAATACAKSPDLNHDGMVDVSDLLIMLGSWGRCPANSVDCPADLTCNGVVDDEDLVILLESWGPVPPTR